MKRKAENILTMEVFKEVKKIMKEYKNADGNKILFNKGWKEELMKIPSYKKFHEEWEKLNEKKSRI